MLGKLRRLSELSPGELLVFSQLVLFALLALAALTFVRLPRIGAFIASGANKRLLRSLPLFHDHYEIAQLARLCDLSARGMRGDGPCLIRSLLLFWLLKARGEQAKLLIGVRIEAGQFTSHAWIESRGIIVGDSDESALRFNILLHF